MSNSSNALTVIPTELKNQLPIFQVLGDKLPAPAPSTQGRKTLASIFYWALILGGAWWFFKNIDSLLAFAQKSVLFVAFSIVLIVLLLLMPKIVSVLHRLGKTLLFKSEKAIVRGNPVIALQMLLNEAKDTLKRVKDKITHVDGVRIDMIQSGTQAQKVAEEKYALVKKLAADASRHEALSQEAATQQNPEKANDLNRIAKETRTKAFLFGKEGEAEEHNARSYAQYANQFAKVIEVLKDNESAARIYVSTLDSSIRILNKKLEATQKMKNATEGLADVFNIKDGWVFQEAMSAATQAISQNIASIRSNLEFLDQNNNITVGGAPSQQELDAFVKKVDERNLTVLNVPMIGSSNYDLKPEEKIDKGFSLLN
jgi:flagellar biosynthesis/type III secretory pathway chaperone